MKIHIPNVKNSSRNRKHFARNNEKRAEMICNISLPIWQYMMDRFLKEEDKIWLYRRMLRIPSTESVVNEEKNREKCLLYREYERERLILRIRECCLFLDI